jgi:predicted transcriptional regulator
MQTLKDITIDVIKGLPDTCSVEEIMYQINLVANVVDGLKDEEKGNLISTNDLLKKIESWQQK